MCAAACRLPAQGETPGLRPQAILDHLVEERGEPSLEYLRHLPDKEIKAELSKCAAPRSVSQRGARARKGLPARAYRCWAHSLCAPSLQQTQARRLPAARSVPGHGPDPAAGTALPHGGLRRVPRRFKGVGKKTVACVLMFCLGSHEFPVECGPIGQHACSRQLSCVSHKLDVHAWSPCRGHA